MPVSAARMRDVSNDALSNLRSFDQAHPRRCQVCAAALLWRATRRRYLEQAFMKLDWEAFELVREALHERAFMLRSADFHARPQPILIPLYRWWEVGTFVSATPQVPYMWVGTKVYDIVAGKNRAVPPSSFLSKVRSTRRLQACRKRRCTAILASRPRTYAEQSCTTMVSKMTRA